MRELSMCHRSNLLVSFLNHKSEIWYVSCVKYPSLSGSDPDVCVLWNTLRLWMHAYVLCYRGLGYHWGSKILIPFLINDFFAFWQGLIDNLFVSQAMKNNCCYCYVVCICISLALNLKCLHPTSVISLNGLDIIE